jgi:hypothetical protein
MILIKSCMLAPIVFGEAGRSLPDELTRRNRACPEVLQQGKYRRRVCSPRTPNRLDAATD